MSPDLFGLTGPGAAEMRRRDDTGATFSPCRTYRYDLTRTWDRGRPPMVVIGLNPSTADETADDPTIRRCVGFARSWACGGLVMLNLFAVRATDPRVMLAHAAPVGPENDAAIRRHTGREGVLVLCAWGAHGTHQGRGAEVLADLLRARRWPYALGTTAGGQPRHPLYLRADAQPQPYGWTETAPP